jgi:uncharacterized hydrophobic protein (TIGR00341 family)
MTLRLIEMRLPGERSEEVLEALSEVAYIEQWVLRTENGGRHTWHVLAHSGQVEAIVDALESNFSLEEGFRIILFKIEAAIPRPEEDEEDETNATTDETGGEAKDNGNKAPINIEELYEDITHDVEMSWSYVAMVAVSALVAAVGIFRDDTVLIIAAMIIAPLLSPNMALSLATTLADSKLGKLAVQVNLLGLTVAFLVAFLFGLLVPFDPDPSAASLRTTIGMLDVAVAASAGTAGALSFTRVAPGGVVGVMIAVALVPPVVSFGMLAGAGLWALSVVPLLLATMNIICINLAGVVTFFVQRIRPRSRWGDERAKTSFRKALLIWMALLTALLATVYFAGDYWQVAW